MAPTTKCTACANFLASAVAVNCAHCPCIYHRACVAIPDTAPLAKDWVCPECKKKQRKTDNSSTPVKTTCGNRPGTSLALLVDAAAPAAAETAPWVMSPELTQYMAEQREFRSEIRAALKSMGERMDDMERRMVAVEQGAAPAPGAGAVDELRQCVARLQSELATRDQDLLLADLDIGQLPEERGEGPVQAVCVLAAKLGVTLEARDVVFAERVGAQSEAAGKARSHPLVVRLARRDRADGPRPGV